MLRERRERERETRDDARNSSVKVQLGLGRRQYALKSKPTVARTARVPLFRAPSIVFVSSANTFETLGDVGEIRDDARKSSVGSSAPTIRSRIQTNGGSNDSCSSLSRAPSIVFVSSAVCLRLSETWGRFETTRVRVPLDLRRRRYALESKPTAARTTRVRRFPEPHRSCLCPARYVGDKRGRERDSRRRA